MQIVDVFLKIVNVVNLIKNVLIVRWKNVAVKCPTNNHNFRIDLKDSPTNHHLRHNLVVPKNKHKIMHGVFSLFTLIDKLVRLSVLN